MTTDVTSLLVVGPLLMIKVDGNLQVLKIPEDLTTFNEVNRSKKA